MDSLAGLPNPFQDTIVLDPWQPAPIDVATIHARAFQCCCEALEVVRSQGRSTSVLLHGQPGSGKTHLLGRFRAQVIGQPRPRPDLSLLDAVFVSVRMNTSARMVWRHVRRCFVDDLLRLGKDGITQLEALLFSRLARVRGAEGDLRLWWEWLREEHPSPDQFQRLLDDLFDALDQEANLGRSLCKVLGHLLMGRHRRDARAWLRGEPLPESTLAALGLSTAAEEDEEQEDRAHQTVLALCRLAGAVPLIFCFDQVEALQRHPQDQEGLFALGQVVAALHDETRNALLISCIQTSFLDRIRDTVHKADWVRLAKRENSLD